MGFVVSYNTGIERRGAIHNKRNEMKMMMRSMTGFGRGENGDQNRKFSVEIKSVNHRYNDITIKLPRTMNFLEERARKALQAYIFRGKTDVYILFESYSQNDIQIILNEPLADAYVGQLRQIQQRYGLQDEITLSLVAKFPDIISVEKTVEDEEQLWSLLQPALESAVQEFVSMREREGEALKQDLIKKLSNIETLVEEITLRAPFVVLEYKERLQTRLREWMEGKDIDEARLMTEVTIFADRCSIDEELIRLRSHISQLRKILDTKDSVGRKLDFLIQEMNREANTIGSKANDLMITQSTIEVKSEIEKIREQVQNIE